MLEWSVVEVGTYLITRGVSRACWASLSKPSVQHVEGSLESGLLALSATCPFDVQIR
jgi:hypothetical protein